MEITVNLAGWLVAALTLAFTFYQHRLSERRLAEATEGQRKAEKELADMRSRGEGPYLAPSNQLCGHIYEQTGKDIVLWPTTGSNVLCSQREEVSDLKSGDLVILLLENSGRNARRIRIDAALKNCTIKQEPDFDSSHGYIFLKYEYEPEQHGKTVQLSMSFEAPSGFQDTHVYETIHGRRVFTRVKP